MATIETLTCSSTNALIKTGSGGCGSPSEMMIMCLVAASVFFSASRPLRIVPTKLGMSPGEDALIFVTISSYLFAGVISNTHCSVPS